MKAIFITVLLFIIASNSIIGQRKVQVIRGEVFDESTKLPLIGVTIELLGKDTLLGATTDKQGRFVIEKVPFGRYDLSFSYLGYATYVENSVLINSLDDVLLEIGLSEKAADLGEIVIKSNQRNATNEAAVVSAKSFNLEELGRIPAAVDDPARMARKLPGVSPTSQITSNIINIRGNSGRAVRWRLDEIDIYNPNHFGIWGSSGGSLTIFSQRLLTSTDFYSGAFPADYGNVLGGVFDVRFRNGNTQKRQHSIRLSVLGIDLATEGPMDKKGNSSYIINYRLSSTWLIDLFLKIGAIPLFQDLSFKFHFKLPNSGVLNVFGIAGINSLSSVPALDTATWNTRPQANLGTLTQNITGTFGLSYLQPLGNKTYTKHTLIGTGLNAQQRSYYQNRDLVTADTTRKGLDNEIRVSYSGYVNHKFNNNHTHRSGLILHGLYSNVFYVEADDPNNGGKLTDTLRHGEGMSMLVQAFTRSQFYFKKWQFNVGLHAMYLLYNHAYSIEPRLGVRYSINKKNAISFGYGLHSQMEPFFVHISRQYDKNTRQFIQKNRNLKFNKAHHFVLSYETEILSNFRMGIELYYQYQYDLVVGKNKPISRVGGYGPKFESFDLNNGGIANNYGVELVVEKGFNKGYYILFNTSLFEANYTANDKVVRPSAFNAQYIFNLVGGKEWQLGKKKASFLNLNLSFTYSGPQYYTPVDLNASINKGRYIADYTRPNASKQDPVLLIDFSLVYKLNGKKTNSEFILQINNVLNQRTISSEYYDREKKEVAPYYGTGIIPVIGWRISF